MAAAKKREAEPVAEPSYFDEDDEDDDVELDLVWGTEDDEEPGEGDEEIFNFETGWNLEALGVDGDDEEDDSEQAGKSSKSSRGKRDDSQSSTDMLLNVPIPARLRKQLLKEKNVAFKAAKADKQDEKEKPSSSASRRDVGANIGSSRQDVKRTVHKKLRIVSGRFGSRRLLSPDDQNVRPMMEKVRGAVFSILQSYLSATAGFPAGSRWLDLFSGTGAVGLEGMSRGCDEAHFVEADPWVVERCLGKNIAACGAEYHTTVHTQFVEAFLRRVQDAPDSVGGAFDFISVTPPYEKVSYEELFALLDASPLIHEGTIVIVEYARREKRAIPDELGPLVKIRDRKYGRTFVAIYGPLDPNEDYYDDDEEEEDDDE